jgi:hypothetical protein
MSRLLLEICPERPASNGAALDLPPILICSRDGQDALAYDAMAGVRPLILRIQDAGYALEQSSTTQGSATLGIGQWHNAEGWKLRVTQSAAPEGHLAAMDVASPSWAAPELRITTYDGDRLKRLRCMLPVEEGGQLVVGRGGAKADLILEDDHVSRTHLRFFVDQGQQMVEDLGSRWGTKLNGQPLTDPKPLKHGDEIRLGKSTINYVNYWDIVPQADAAAASADKASAVDDFLGTAESAPPLGAPPPEAKPKSVAAPPPPKKQPEPAPPPEKPKPQKGPEPAAAKPAPPKPEPKPEPPKPAAVAAATPQPQPKPAEKKQADTRASALPWALALVLLLIAGIAYLAYLVFKH